MKKPISIPMVSADVSLSFDAEGFDQLLRDHGVTLVHHKAMRCPIGMTDPDDSRQPTHNHTDCSNGAIYKRAGVVTCLFQSNQLNTKITDAGLVDGATAVVTFPRYYDKLNESDQLKELVVSPFDRFYLQDVEAEVVNWELIEANLTGTDRLQYPAISVEYLIDANGKEYEPGIDFVVESGRIKWVGARPGQNVRAENGVVYSIRYRYCPFWYCRQLLHEIRVSRADDYVSGQRKFVRMPYSASLVRENVFENEQRGRGVGDDRDSPEPSSGSFGPK